MRILVFLISSKHLQADLSIMCSSTVKHELLWYKKQAQELHHVIRYDQATGHELTSTTHFKKINRSCSG